MGQADPSLEDTVSGILKFMHRKGIISVETRESKAGRLAAPVHQRVRLAWTHSERITAF